MSVVDYEGTYSPVMDVITFRFLITLVASNKLDMQLIDVIKVYLYRLFEKDIYLKIPRDTKCQTLRSTDICTLLNFRGLFMG